MSIDRGAIDEQLKNIGEGERWWEQREFRELPYILNEDEVMHGLIRGKVLGRRRPRLLPAGDWLIAATSQRLLCIRDERFGRKQIDVPLGQIRTMHHNTGMFAAQITLQTSERSYRLRIAKDEAFRFVGALGPLVPRPQPASTARFGLPAVLNAARLQALPSMPALATLPHPDYATRSDLLRLEGTVERLEGEVDRLQQQVNFLENLLQQRAGREIQAGQRVGGTSVSPPSGVARIDQPAASSSSHPAPRTVTDDEAAPVGTSRPAAGTRTEE